MLNDTEICLFYIHVFSLWPSEILQHSKRVGFHTTLPSTLSKMLPRENGEKTSIIYKRNVKVCLGMLAPFLFHFMHSQKAYSFDMNTYFGL